MEITGAQLRTTAQPLNSLSIACFKNLKTYSQLSAFHFATDLVKLAGPASGHIHQSRKLNSTLISLPGTKFRSKF